MKSRRFIWIVGALILALGSMALCLWVTMEPSDQGKKLSVWLQEMYSGPPETFNTGAEAVRHMGTKAVPCLLRKLRSSDSRLKLTIVELLTKQSLIRFHFTPAADRRAQAACGFVALGPAATEAIPALAELLYQAQTAKDAAWALAGISEEGLREVTEAITNRNAKIRAGAAAGLGLAQPKNRAAVLALVARLQDEDHDVRGQAAYSLGLMLREADIVVPALATRLQDRHPLVRMRAATALGEFGARAEPVVAALSNAIRDSDGSVVNAAIKARERIQAEIAVRAEGRP
ncbi:MAG: hypothetical protein DME18_16530 [Verrucomicrobia bacterium]|nr:MAG: hypothetical protein DME18_16530 [Verrucomicrobiota bacterium]